MKEYKVENWSENGSGTTHEAKASERHSSRPLLLRHCDVMNGQRQHQTQMQAVGEISGGNGRRRGRGRGKSRGEGGWSIWAAVSFVRLCQRRRFWRTAFHNPAPTIIIWWRRLFKWRAFNLQMSLDPSLWKSFWGKLTVDLMALMRLWPLEYV